jgi:hypothetical protein
MISGLLVTHLREGLRSWVLHQEPHGGISSRQNPSQLISAKWTECQTADVNLQVAFRRIDQLRYLILRVSIENPTLVRRREHEVSTQAL